MMYGLFLRVFTMSIFASQSRRALLWLSCANHIFMVCHINIFKLHFNLTHKRKLLMIKRSKCVKISPFISNWTSPLTSPYLFLTTYSYNASSRSVTPQTFKKKLLSLLQILWLPELSKMLLFLDHDTDTPEQSATTHSKRASLPGCMSRSRGLYLIFGRRAVSAGGGDCRGDGGTMITSTPKRTWDNEYDECSNIHHSEPLTNPRVHFWWKESTGALITKFSCLQNDKECFKCWCSFCNVTHQFRKIYVSSFQNCI